MLCIIDGRMLTELDRLVLDSGPQGFVHGGFGLLDQCLDLVNKLLPEAEVRVVREAGNAVPDRDEPRWMSLYDQVLPDIYESGPVLLVCPGSGVVCRSLLQRLLVRLPKAPGGVVASADLLHHNAHPCWVMRAEGCYDPDEKSYEHDASFRFFMDTVEGGGAACIPGEPLPEPGQVVGSHRLPELLLATDAVVLAASGQALATARAGGEVERLPSGKCPDIPPIYRQPIFCLAF